MFQILLSITAGINDRLAMFHVHLIETLNVIIVVYVVIVKNFSGLPIISIIYKYMTSVLFVF